ncbi:endosomal integral membrane protein [Trypanosoma theileri]|uniref:Transmembrane 9 superfamily member n=1 Tax=Trypanosoma theileri TaxID=67003 RepID=A0A1X0P6M4_9TRYP|nr:endosomal integral membrane protein [Trypanosoma theileri]ORC92587.1 endosomal integral membrane protein [Trypanosoma theileri]
MRRILLLLVFILCISPGICVSGLLYVPGLAPTARRFGDEVRLEVNKLYSLTNELPYPYYEPRTPFCPPIDKHELGLRQNLGLGALLSGARPQWSSYTFYMLLETCDSVECEDQTRLTAAQVKWMQKLIEKNYRAQIMLDDIPVYSDAAELFQGGCKKGSYKRKKNLAGPQQGFYLGVSSKCTGGPVHLNNHLHFVIYYHTLTPTEAMNYEEGTAPDGTKVQMLRKRNARQKVKKNKENNLVGDTIITNDNLKADIPMDDNDFYGDGDDDDDDDDDRYTKNTEDTAFYTIVDVTVQGFSVDWRDVKDGRPSACPGVNNNNEERILFENSSLNIMDIKNGKYPPLVLNNSLTNRSIAWTYTVEWHEQPDLQWGTNWEKYFNNKKNKQKSGIHYFFIIYSLLIVLSMTSVVVFIVIRALRRDFALYNSLLEKSKEDNFDSILEDHGWKAVSGDVFRLPKRADDLVVLVVSGIHVFFLTAIFILGTWIQYEFSSNRQSIIMIILIQFLLSSLPCGIFTVWLSKSLHLPQRWLTIIKYVCGLPGVVFITFLLSNIVLRLARSTGAVSFVFFIFLSILWICVFVPLAFIGAKFGFLIPVSTLPRSVNPIPRRINTSLMPVFLQTRYILFLSGLAPVGVVLFELRLLFISLFEGYSYNFFGFLMLVFLLWSLTCGLTSICVVYYRLCAEDYHWWWLSFAAPSSCGLHLILFVIFFYFAVVKMTTVAATVLFTIYMGLLTLFYVLCSGAIGFLSAWKFVNVIFASVKFD